MLTLLLQLYIRLVALTSRIKVSAANGDSILALREERPIIYIFWYQSIIFLMYYFGKRKDMILMSPQGNTDFFTKIASWLGLQISKSSIEGGGRHAILTLIDRIKEGKPVLIPADAARGPEHKFKTSCLIVAQQTAAPIVPVSWKSKWRIKWPRKNGPLYIPLPFSLIEIRLGPSLQIATHHRIEESESIKAQLIHELDRLGQ